MNEQNNLTEQEKAVGFEQQVSLQKGDTRMDIYSPEGTKVIFNHPQSGYNHHIETAKKHLEVGKEYTVDHTYVGDWHTDVYLKEIPEVAFNSVMFDEA
jgi:hypothetical protein